MADRVGVISKGELILVEEKKTLMKKLGKKQLLIQLQEPMRELPAALLELGGACFALKSGGAELEFTFDIHDDKTGIPVLLRRMGDLGIGYKDLSTHQSSLEDIFVSLVRNP